jgi:hypothetical protein
MGHVDNALFYIVQAIEECKSIMDRTMATDFDEAQAVYARYLHLCDIALQLKLCIQDIGPKELTN